MNNQLIYDVGMFNGQDTAYYLKRGFRVIGIEANPLFAEAVVDTHKAAIDAGQLVVLNVGISDKNGVAPFWICDEYPAFSTFNEIIKAGSTHQFRSMSVPTTRMRDVFAQYGVPFYLKVDIEGSDRYCLEDIDQSDAPPYVSFELLDLEDLMLLKQRGYTHFKCILQSTLKQLERQQLNTRELLKHFDQWMQLSLPRWISRGARAAHRTFSRLRVRSSPPAPEPNPDLIMIKEGWSFMTGATGPFGEDTDGEWKSMEEVAFAWLERTFADNGQRPCWADIHAKR